MLQEITFEEVRNSKVPMVIVDVREKSELEGGIIPGSLHWALSHFKNYEKSMSQTQPTVFYCQSGVRSLSAAKMAKNWTQQDVFSLKGGYKAYTVSQSQKSHPKK